MIAATNSNTIVTIVGIVLGSGLLGALYAGIRKLGAGTFTVTAAKGVLVMATDIAEELRKDLDEARDQIKELQSNVAQFDALKRENERLREDIRLAERREEELKRRVLDLEAEVTKLKNGTP